jgi:hypothetical protein
MQFNKEPTEGLIFSTKNSQDEMEANLKAAWTAWLNSGSQRRLMGACFILHTRQSIYHEQPTAGSTLDLVAECSSWLPCPEKLWEAISATVWVIRLLEHKAQRRPGIAEAVLAPYFPFWLEKQNPIPFSHLILLCSRFSELPARNHPTYPNDIDPLSFPPFLEKFTTRFRHDYKGNAFSTFYYIPLQDLLATTGDTWYSVERSI